MRTTVVLAATLFALSLIGCTAPSATPEAPAAPEAPVAAQPEQPAQPAQPATPEPATTPVVAEPAPGSTPAASPITGAPLNPSRACKTDADCAVKNVGNCCGAFPACVNKDAKTDPQAVQAQCAKDGMASICGFKEISGCQCVQGTCQDIGSGEQVM
ncbi:MAG TPA: hypothetical protein VGE64_01670 [Xanthomonadaceae bacterium]